MIEDIVGRITARNWRNVSIGNFLQTASGTDNQADHADRIREISREKRITKIRGDEILQCFVQNYPIVGPKRDIRVNVADVPGQIDVEDRATFADEALFVRGNRGIDRVTAVASDEIDSSAD